MSALFGAYLKDQCESCRDAVEKVRRGNDGVELRGRDGWGEWHHWQYHSAARLEDWRSVRVICAVQLSEVGWLEQEIGRLRDALIEVEKHCPCGARPESLHRHHHVIGCPVGDALQRPGIAEAYRKAIQP
jgi:hypothetical protein